MLIKKYTKYILITALMLMTGIGLTYYMYYNSENPSTDDAYIDAHTVQVVSQVNGLVDQVYVKNHQRVHKGQLLFTVDAAPFKIALAKAQANLQLAVSNVKAAQDNAAAAASLIQQRQAELTLAKTTLARYQSLYKNKYIAKQVLDNSVKQVAVAQTQLLVAQQQYQQAHNQVGGKGEYNAQIEAAKATVASAQLDLQHTKVYASADGILAQCSLHEADAVQAYQPIFSLIDDSDFWVDANFKETELHKFHINQPVEVHIDMYPGMVFKGSIAAISYGSGDSFSLMPSENASGNWVKVTQRFEVKVQLQHVPNQYPLRVGASVSVRVIA
tara:strand:+ start:4106 stop:5092 length:987 start_codon:yes stop_codon:yes gene_type:complete